MHTWWMLAVRGGLGILLGAVVLLSPHVALGEVVALFGIYVVLDGICAVAWGIQASRWLLEGWPVVLEGAVSFALGVAALGFPFKTAQFVHMIAAWGLVTGILEILAAVRPPRGMTGHWALVAAGVWSIFLAVLIVSLPHAVTDSLVDAVGVYALVFGVLVSTIAVFLHRVSPRVTVRPVDHTWTTR